MSLPDSIPLRREPQLGDQSGASNAPKTLLGLFKPNLQGGGLQLRESRRLTQNHSVHEVQWRGRTLLIGCSSQTIQLLAEAPPSASQAEASASNPEGASI